METFPLFFKLNGASVLVVGGGEVARHKANMLSKAGAIIDLVAPDLHPSTQLFVDQQDNVTHHKRLYQASDSDGRRLIVAATDTREVNYSITKDAEQRNTLVNVVDMPELGNTIFPSIVDRSPLVIAIGSGGRSPVLVRLLRARIESLIPAAYGELSALVGSFKARAKAVFPNLDLRRRFWDKHLQGTAGTLAMSGRMDEAREVLEKAFNSGETYEQGEVYLVGGGPGDPDLLTFKALRLMQQADVVLYDRLVSSDVLDLVRREAERIYVGKDKNPYSITQENINQALVDYAKQGLNVLRLKGGDPFIFGRGGEELETLAEHDIPFQVVPAVTAASGCASYAGIPLTHRDHCQSVRFITGHLKQGELNLPWAEFVTGGQTLVFYMGLSGLDRISEKLIEHGMHPDMPAAMVEKGTLPEQRVFTATIKTLPDIVHASKLEAPTLIIIGTVVTLRTKLGTSPSGVDV